MNKKIIFLLLVILGIISVVQPVSAANPILSVSPATASKNVGATINVAVKIDPQGNKVCVVKGALSFDNLTCKSITVATGLMSQTMPTCAIPNFILGIPKCATAAQNILTVSVKGNNVGRAKVSLTESKVIGVGVIIPFDSQGGAYNITAIPTPPPAPTPISISCTPNWQTDPWGICADGQQTRTVTDLNNCGVIIDEPDTIQSCAEQFTAETSATGNVGAASLISSIGYLLSSPVVMIILAIIFISIIFWSIIIFYKKRRKERNIKK